MLRISACTGELITIKTKAIGIQPYDKKIKNEYRILSYEVST